MVALPAPFNARLYAPAAPGELARLIETMEAGAAPSASTLAPSAPVPGPGCVTGLMTEQARRATKAWRWVPDPAAVEAGQWVEAPIDLGHRFAFAERECANVRELGELIDDHRRDPRVYFVRGVMSEHVREAEGFHRRLTRGPDATLIDAPLSWLVLDVDGWALPEWGDLVADPEPVIDAAIREVLPPEFSDVECFWQLSASAGIKAGLRCHLWFCLNRPLTNADAKSWLDTPGRHPALDLEPLHASQPIFTADPIITGRPSPILRRTGFLEGAAEAVEVPDLRRIRAEVRKTQAVARASTPGGPAGTRSFDAALARVGDPPGNPVGLGFHEAITLAIWAYACTTPPAQRDAGWLKARVREVALKAPRRAGRTDAEVADRLAEAGLDRSIAGAFAKAAPPAEARVGTEYRPVSLAPYYPAPSMGLDETLKAQGAVIAGVIEGAVARAQIRRTIRETMKAEAGSTAETSGRERARILRRVRRDVLAKHERTAVPRARRVLVSGSQGTGKTRTILETTAAVRAPGGGRAKVIAQVAEPFLEKAEEAHRDYERMIQGQPDALPGMVVRGRGAPDPDAPDKTMCLRREVAESAARAGVRVRERVCSTCPLRDQCGSEKQAARVAALAAEGAVFFTARAALFTGGVVPAPDLVIADESIVMDAAEPVELPASALRDRSTIPGLHGPDETSAMTTLGDIHDALRDPAPLRALRQASVTRERLMQARGVIEGWLEAERAGVNGALADGALAAILKRLEGCQAGRVVLLLDVLARELDAGGEVLNCVTYQPGALVTVNGRPERQERITVHALRPLRGIPRGASVLLSDGTGNADLNRRVLGPGPDLEHHYLPIDRQGDVTGIRGKSYSRQSLTGLNAKGDALNKREGAAAQLRGELIEVAESLPDPALMVATKGAEKAFRADLLAGTTIQTAHFGAVRGMNAWEGCQSAVVVGRESVSLEMLEALTRCFLAGDPEPFISFDAPAPEGWAYPHWPYRACRTVRMTDGTFRPMEVEVHPDLRAQAVLEQIREAEVTQAADRPRLIFNAGKRLVLACSLALPFVYDRILTHAELVAGEPPLEQAWRERGVIPLGAKALAGAFPDLFSTRAAAEWALTGKGPVAPNGISYLAQQVLSGRPVLAAYRTAGQRGSSSQALIDADRHPDPRAALAAVVGDLSAFEVRTAAEPSAPAGPALHIVTSQEDAPATADGSEASKVPMRCERAGRRGKRGEAPRRRAKQ